MIEDKELRDLFKIESEEHLQRLDDGLLQLEKSPEQPALLEELFRSAHSLKGAARMLGLLEIQNLAHQLEDTLGVAKRGEKALDGETTSGMYQMLNTIRQLVREAVSQAENAPPVAARQVPASPVAPPSPSATPGMAPEPFRIDTIRVDPARLDALMSQAGELTVTRIRIARRMAELEAALDYCEEWGRAEVKYQAGVTDMGDTLRKLTALKETLGRLRDGAGEDSARLNAIAEQIESGIRTMRLLPMSALFGQFPRLVQELARDQHKEAELFIEGGATVADKRILEEMKDPLMHLLRNAVDHGIEPPEQRVQAGKAGIGAIRLRASQTASSVIIEVSDDGQGLDLDAIRHTALKRGLCTEEDLAVMSVQQIQALILAPGFSTSSFVTDISGRGVGLDVVSNNVERLKGRLELDSSLGKGLTVRMHLPVSLATVRVMLVAVQGRNYALPVEFVRFSRMLRQDEVYTMEGQRTVTFEHRAVSVARLQDLLELTDLPPQPGQMITTSTHPCVVMVIGDEFFGVIVDALIDELEVVLKPQGAILKRVRNIAGATILETGEVCMVLNPQDLLKTMRKQPGAALPTMEVAVTRKVLLLAEDSITTRTQEKRILENAGYEVVAAVDGLDAFNKLGTRHFDAVVSDITMPNLDGLALTARIRADKKYAELPVILVSSHDTEDDKRRGLEAGANAYITKPEFDQQVLLECLARLV